MERDSESRQVVQAVRGYVEGLDKHLDAGQGLWFIGNPGTGKTTLAMLIAKEALAMGKTVAVYFTPTLLTQIRQTYQATNVEDAYEAFFKRLTSVDLLYIDDLGSERQTDWVVEQLYAIVNERYEREGSMLITSNADFDQNIGKAMANGKDRLVEQVGSRTVSRLNQICGEPMPLFGIDRRSHASLST